MSAGDKGHAQKNALKRTQAERSAGTRAALLAAARELFGAHGFAGAGREDIAERAGVTRGALYHHFENKQQLFYAVVEELEAALTERVALAAMHGADARAQLELGCQAFLDSAMDPAIRRILLLDAPAVLGWQAWRELDERFGLGLVKEVLTQAMADGSIEEQPVEPLAHMLLAAMNEAAMLVALADDPAAARAEVGVAVERLLGRL